MNASRDFRFDGWVLRRDSGELVRGDVRVRLQSQPLAVLEALLARAGEVVTRDDLKSSLWPTGVVDFDTALNSAVRRLRRSLGDDANEPRYIETLPRKGYRFIGTLESAVPKRRASDGTMPQASSPAATTGVAPPAADAPHDALRMPAPSRMRPWLSTAAVCVAGVSAMALLAMQHAPRRVAQPAGAAPAAAVIPAPPATRATAPPPDLGLETMDHLTRARLFLQRRVPGDLERARSLLEETIARHPRLAEAHAALASAHWHLVLQELQPHDAGLESMRAAAARALALDPASTEAHLRLANYGYATADARYARHMDVVRDTASGSALAYGVKATEALVAGRADEGVDLARRAALAEPLAAVHRYNLASALYMARRYAEAERANYEAQELSPAVKGEIAAMVMIQQRRFDEALAIANGWADGPARREVLALAYAGAGRTAAADAALRSLIELAREHDPLRVAEVYAYRGENDRAFEWLAKGSRAPDRTARLRRTVAPWMLMYSPFLASLHADPRWQAWVAATNAT